MWKFQLLFLTILAFRDASVFWRALLTFFLLAMFTTMWTQHVVWIIKGFPFQIKTTQLGVNSSLLIIQVYSEWRNTLNVFIRCYQICTNAVLAYLCFLSFVLHYSSPVTIGTTAKKDWPIIETTHVLMINSYLYWIVNNKSLLTSTCFMKLSLTSSLLSLILPPFYSSQHLC